MFKPPLCTACRPVFVPEATLAQPLFRPQIRPQKKRGAGLAFSRKLAEDGFVNPVRQVMDDTKGKGAPAQTEKTKGGARKAAEPEQVIREIQHQATHLGPVLEEILRQTHQHGQSHWGLNE